MTTCSSGKVSLTVLPCNKLPDLSVAVGIDAPKANWFALRKLKREKQTTDPQYEIGSSLTALCYAMFKGIEYKLKGEPTSLKKYGVSTMDCAVQNGQFIIRFNCPGRLSSLIRCLDATVQMLTPARCNPGFKHACRNLNCKPDDNAFAELERQINKGVKIFAVGKVTLKAPKPRAGPKKGGERSPAVIQAANDAATAARFSAMTKPKSKVGGGLSDMSKQLQRKDQLAMAAAVEITNPKDIVGDIIENSDGSFSDSADHKLPRVYDDHGDLKWRVGDSPNSSDPVVLAAGGGPDDVEDEDDEKAGGGPVTADEAKKCCMFVAEKLDGKFPKLAGGAGNTEHKNHGFTEHDIHYDIRCKAGLSAYLTASYIESSSEAAVDVISGTIVVWVKSFDGKLRSISEKDAIKRWVSGKFDKLKELTVPFAIYFMMNNDHRDTPDTDTLAKAAKNGIGELVGEIHGCLSA